jgi:hypothetical protein
LYHMDEIYFLKLNSIEQKSFVLGNVPVLP